MPCADPVAIPAGPASQRTVERLWGRDRAALLECRDRHAALGGYYAVRDAGLVAPSNP